MPLSTLDPDIALIIVDLQAGIAQRTAGLLTDVIANAAALARAFRAHGQTVVLVNVSAGRPRAHRLRAAGWHDVAGSREVNLSLDM